MSPQCCGRTPSPGAVPPFLSLLETFVAVCFSQSKLYPPDLEAAAAPTPEEQGVVSGSPPCHN